jgi:biopolymer transport protein ExbD
MFAKKGKKSQPEINASSMADIAFLLLIFFLVTTTIASDKGLSILLPPKKDPNDNTIVEIKDHNVFKVLINSKDMLLVEDKPMDVVILKEEAKKFLSNNGVDPHLSENPQKAVISVKTDRGTSYETYIKVMDQLKGAYHELRAEAGGITLQEYLDLDIKKPKDRKIYDKVKDMYPLQISEAEPTTIGGN